MNIKKASAMGAALLALTLLAGCAPSPDSAFVESVHGKVPALADAFTDHDLIGIGKAVCAELENGMSQHGAAAILESNGMSIAEAGFVVLASVDKLCPQFSGD